MRRHIVLGAALALVGVLMNCAPAMAGKSMELRSANTYYNQGDLKQALEWYEKADQKDTREGQVYARLVEIYADQKRWREMTRAFSRLDGCADKPSDLKDYREDARRVIDQLWMGLWNGSIEQSNLAVSSLEKGDSAAVRDHLRQARERMTTALEILPDRVQFHKRLGDLFINEFNMLHADAAGFPLLEQAAASYTGLVASHPDSVDFAVTLTQLHYNSRRYDQARQVADQALTRFPDHGELLNFAGKVRIQQGLALKNDAGELPAEGKRLMGEATAFLDRAIALNPGDAMLIYNLALLYDDMGDAHKALETFRRVESVIPPPAAGASYAPEQAGLLFDSWYNMAVLYFQDLPDAEQDAAMAAECFEKCLSLQPDNRQLKFNLGVALVRTGVKEKVDRGKVLMKEGQ